LAEWRIFPGTSLLRDDLGYQVFTAAHVPLFALLLLGLFGSGTLNRSLVFGLNVFFIIHVGLHLFALRHHLNQFTSGFSWALIAGSGLFGALDLLVNAHIW
jgi:hypothetical protein